ncbi:MAG: DUF2141 domain-containing protein [Planctomycetota bacterium]
MNKSMNWAIRTQYSYLRIAIVFSLLAPIAGCHLAKREQAELDTTESQELPENAGSMMPASEVSGTSPSSLAQQGIGADIDSVAQFPNVLNASASNPSTSNSVKPDVPSLHITGVQSGGGPVRIAIFAANDSFPDHATASFKEAVEATEPSVDFVVANKPEGSYAIAVYQDLNGDGQLNRGSFGIPLEPYGFSNNAKGTMGPPRYQAAAVAGEAKELGIELSQVKF